MFERGHRPDYFLIATVAILTVAGLVILTSASSELGKIRWNDSFYYLKHQLLYGLLPGALGFAFAYAWSYRSYRALAFPLLLANLVLLALIFTHFGISAGGATRWLRLGPLSFQPAELLKITFIVYLAAWFTNPRMNRARDIAKGLVPFLLLAGLVGGLLIIQPATSTVVILLAASVVMYFVGGGRLSHIMSLGVLGAAALALIVYLTPYRLDRIQTFWNPTADTQGSSYQATQAKIAIGSGNVSGMGFGQSPNKIGTLPAPLGDSIFAIAAQELGFLGAGSLVVLFGMLAFRLFWLAGRARDRFGTLMLVGFGSIVAFQAFVNMAAISGLIPLTGVPLPFVSYGGTALAVFLTMMGISVNISKYT